MNALIDDAHPEPKRLNGALKDRAVETLTRLCWRVDASDLYAPRCKATAEGDDVTERADTTAFDHAPERTHAAKGGGGLAPDVAVEIRDASKARLRTLERTGPLFFHLLEVVDRRAAWTLKPGVAGRTRAQNVDGRAESGR